MRVLAALTAAIAVYASVMTAARWNAPARAPRARKVSSRPDLQTRLRHAGASLSAARYRLIVAGAMVATTVVVWWLTRTWSLAVPTGVAVGFAPRAWVGRRSATVVSERTAAWPEALRDVLAHLAVGNTLAQSLALLGVTGPEPLRPVFGAYETNSQLYGPVAALELVRVELADPVADRVVEVLIAAHDLGTEVIIELLRSLIDNVTSDVNIRESIRSGQAELKAEAVAAAVLPFLALGYLCVSSEPYREFYASAAGWFVIGLGAAMSFTGWKVMGRLAQLPAEQRVMVDTGGDR